MRVGYTGDYFGSKTHTCIEVVNAKFRKDNILSLTDVNGHTVKLEGLDALQGENVINSLITQGYVNLTGYNLTKVFSENDFFGE